MKFICALILCLALLQVSKEDTVSTESNQIDKQSEEIENNNDKIKMILESMFGQELEDNYDQLKDSQEIETALRRELESRPKLIQYFVEIATELRRELESKYDPVGKCSMPTVRGELSRQHRIMEKLEMNLSEKQNDKIEELKDKILSKSENLENCEKELNSHKNTIARLNKYLTSCITKYSSGEYMIKHHQGFEVLCNSYIAGHGWTVIQQRIDGKVDFYKNWDSYRDGFGDFWNGSFFLGLEKIHRLTAEEPHEIYIHMERFNGSSYYARYEEFAIAGEDDQFELIKLGPFSGSTKYDMMSFHGNKKFSTYDRDNDDYDGNCAEKHHGAWWYSFWAFTNLNGRYYPTEVEDEDTIFWEEFTSLKQVKMMIRPKVTLK